MAIAALILSTLSLIVCTALTIMVLAKYLSTTHIQYVPLGGSAHQDLSPTKDTKDPLEEFDVSDMGPSGMDVAFQGLTKNKEKTNNQVE